MDPAVEQTSSDTPERIVRTVTNSSGMTININIQLQLPESADAEIYSKFFKAMKEHLLD